MHARLPRILQVLRVPQSLPMHGRHANGLVVVTLQLIACLLFAAAAIACARRTAMAAAACGGQRGQVRCSTASKRLCRARLAPSMLAHQSTHN